MPNFTPAPWRQSPSVENRVDGPSDGFIGPNVICTLTNPVNYSQDANAKLIAAAPELYECLNHIVEHGEFWSGAIESDGMGELPFSKEFGEQCRRAIATAKGKEGL